VVFSESSDTVEYLKKHINRKDVLTIDATNRSEKFTKIKENFDTNIKKEKQKNDYNIILTTEVLAEGVNLHRSNIVINYDTPWNSTRLMQRIGRVNRIGSIAKNIYNFVFYPSAKGNEQINLVNNSLAKIQAFHTAFGEDNQIYSTDEIVDLNLDKLFELGLPQEELNREFQYLEEIRALKTENPKEYSRIEKLNLRCRTGRNAQTIDNKLMTNNSLVFLKTDKRIFYLVDDTITMELSALQAIDLFQAKKNETRVPRIENHHKHVKSAEQSFKAQIQKAYYQQTGATASGKQVTTALAFIRKHKNMIENPELLVKIVQLEKLVEWGTITHLATQLNKMENDAEKGLLVAHNCLEQIIEMANHYNSYFLDEQKNKPLEMPCIILSESFN
jgi:superfamily II DNA/RNA helicase